MPALVQLPIQGVFDPWGPDRTELMVEFIAVDAFAKLSLTAVYRKDHVKLFVCFGVEY